MKGNYFRLFGLIVLVSCLGLFISGCVFLVGGAIGAAGGYAISNDTIEGMIDKKYDNLWDAAIRVSNILGNIRFKDRQKGYIESEVGKTKVNINIEKITNDTTKIRIKARRYYKLMPDIPLAQKMYVKIMQEAK
ncbi:MAG: DUF3568 family protein [Candidatus Omnitrophota bacterium]|nr:DUF3568 family protein [Candidatus Omnitrophota bacterium]